MNNEFGTYEHVGSRRIDPEFVHAAEYVTWKGNMNAFQKYTELRIGKYPTSADTFHDLEAFCRKFNCDYSCVQKLFVIWGLTFYCLQEDFIMVKLTCPEAILEEQNDQMDC